MTQNNQTFKAANLTQRFEEACTQFDHLLISANSEELAVLRQKLHDGLQDYKQQGALTVAFIGQYSAGKSTIISALTNRRDIHIDADIATGTTTPYDWNGIKIIDTPGLFTDRTDHDDITYEAISKADLLVFCLTHMLFDTHTVENFKKLAYDKGYRWKIMLVINKMSAAAGEESQKITSYRHSLSEALKPYKIDEFPTSFLDAKDYCEGVDEDDGFLMDISRFDTFISEINQFVERRASLTSLDTPVRIVLSCLDDAQIGFARNSDEDTLFLEVLSRLSRRINKERERLRTRINSITLDMSTAIVEEGNNLASAVGNQEFESLTQQTQSNVHKHYKQAGEAIEQKISDAIESIRYEVEAELHSNLTQALVTQLNVNDATINQPSVSNVNYKQVQGQVEWLQTIGKQVGAKITKAATNELATVGSGFLKSTSVAGSSLHQGVYSVGKFIGFKFKPWQAVGIAKNIGNAAMLLGPVLAVVAIGMDIHAMQKEQEHEEAMANARRDITSQFQAIAVDLEQQIAGQLQEFESQVYAQIERNITAARYQTETSMAESHQELRQLTNIRQDLNLILQDILQAVSPVIV